jgi:hypothetical protein
MVLVIRVLLMDCKTVVLPLPLLALPLRSAQIQLSLEDPVRAAAVDATFVNCNVSDGCSGE